MGKPKPKQQTEYNVVGLLLKGLLFHLVFIGTVFDCYFTSPVVHGMKSHKVEKPETKRLVLIVGDGLRADLLFNVKPFPNIAGSPEIVAPYLRSVASQRGAFGISHTRVPTESRPGHVAIIGGMYEDVSAVTKGWKTNPVDFDSVFNQSSSTFSFGSPDILPMFSRGATPGKVKTWSYNEEDEDFTKDATTLDIWVLDQLRELFQNATSNPILNQELRSEKVVFFLHLLGLDTTGHSYRPHSKEYMRNIQIVDDIVRQTEELISNFYNDDQTSYIFTADHGMSVIGNHGDGDPDNTRTPLIAWGNGIRGPLPDSTPSSHDDYSRPWNLGHLFRRDVEQADIAAIMSSLLGINWPVNSVGVLPDVEPDRPGFLAPALGEESLAKAALVNAKVLLEHYVTKHELKKQRTLLYKPFKPLEGSSPQSRRQAALATIEEKLAAREWTDARRLSQELINATLSGLHYLQTYERSLIRTIVVVAYTGWAAYASLFIFRPSQISATSTTRVAHGAAVTLMASFWTLFAIQRSPWTFYIYVAFPCYFWDQFLVRALPSFNLAKLGNPANILQGLMYTALVTGVLQGMGIGYTHRYVWSIGFLIAGVLWPLTWPRERRQQYPLLAFGWVALNLVMAVFPVLPVEKKESGLLITLGSSAILLAAAGAFYALGYVNARDKRLEHQGLQKLLIVQGALVLLILAITIDSSLSLQAKRGLPAINQIAGWSTLVLATSIPFISGKYQRTPFSKLLVFFLGFGPCFTILSISIEGLFYAFFSMTLATWVVVESLIRHGQLPTFSSKVEGTSYRFHPDDLRIALFFLFFVQVGFFGIGNVASISSFYLEPVYRLIPIFSPFFMAALLIFKIIAPYVILAIAFALLNHALGLPPFSLLLVSLALTDVMTVTFFFQVQDTGSWLEIGQSITFFCITSLLLLWSTGICAVGESLLSSALRVKVVRRSRIHSGLNVYEKTVETHE